jgi:hypothetical protein
VRKSNRQGNKTQTGNKEGYLLFYADTPKLYMTRKKLNDENKNKKSNEKNGTTHKT